jgi:hypothetical protein
VKTKLGSIVPCVESRSRPAWRRARHGTVFNAPRGFGRVGAGGEQSQRADQRVARESVRNGHGEFHGGVSTLAEGANSAADLKITLERRPLVANDLPPRADVTFDRCAPQREGEHTKQCREGRSDNAPPTEVGGSKFQLFREKIARLGAQSPALAGAWLPRRTNEHGGSPPPPRGGL